MHKLYSKNGQCYFRRFPLKRAQGVFRCHSISCFLHFYTIFFHPSKYKQGIMEFNFTKMFSKSTMVSAKFPCNEYGGIEHQMMNISAKISS